MVVFHDYTKSNEIWSCPSVKGSTMGDAVQVAQSLDGTPNSPVSRYWLWRFDRTDDPVPIDDLWGKTPEQSLSDLQAANNPQVGHPDGPSDIEICVDPYFPKTIPSVAAQLKGVGVHFGGRNRLFMDTHAKFQKDIRLNS
jgi:hypothetical protein